MWLEVAAKPNMKVPRLTFTKLIHSSVPEAKSIAPLFREMFPFAILVHIHTQKQRATKE